MGMVLGPFTQQEAAEACECTADQLCPGPMAGIQESDKMGTIFDGSWGGANAHIQENTTERTTAPIVMDCVQALHWLHAIQPGPSTPAGCGPKLTSPRLTDGLGSSNQTGNIRWLNLVLKHGGSTRWAPTAWLQRNYIGENGRVTSPNDLHDLPTDRLGLCLCG